MSDFLLALREPPKETKKIVPVVFTVLQPVTFPSTGREEYIGLSRQTVGILLDQRTPDYEAIDRQTKGTIVPGSIQFFYDRYNKNFEPVKPADNCARLEPALYIGRYGDRFLAFQTGLNPPKKGSFLKGNLALVDLLAFYADCQFSQGVNPLRNANRLYDELWLNRNLAEYKALFCQQAFSGSLSLTLDELQQDYPDLARGVMI